MSGEISLPGYVYYEETDGELTMFTEPLIGIFNGLGLAPTATITSSGFIFFNKLVQKSKTNKKDSLFNKLSFLMITLYNLFNHSYTEYTVDRA